MNPEKKDRSKILIALVFFLLGGGVGFGTARLLKKDASTLGSTTITPATQDKLADIPGVNIEKRSATPTTPTDPNEPKIVEAKVNEYRTVALESNPSTGYHWEADFDPEYLKLEASEYMPPEESLVGKGGVEAFKFYTLKSGTTDITFSYLRSWEEGPIKTWVARMVIE